jgi:hypothetical protein
MNLELDSNTSKFLGLKTNEEKDFSPGFPDEEPYNFYAIKMDLPCVPEELLDSAFDHSNSEILTIGSDRPLNYHGVEVQSAPLRRWSVEQKLTDWIADNIATGYTNVGVQVIHGDQSHTTLGAHTDRRRRFSLFYLVEEGGNNVHTKWYARHGQPAWQDQWIAESDYNNLELLHSQKLQLHQWYLFNGRILHDVDQLTGVRRNIIVGFDRLPSNLEQIARVND